MTSLNKRPFVAILFTSEFHEAIESGERQTARV